MILDFIHTLCSYNPKFGNRGVKIEGDATKKILMWSGEAIHAMQTAIRSSPQSAEKQGYTKSEVITKKLLETNKLVLEEISEVTGTPLEQIKEISTSMSSKTESNLQFNN